MAQNDSITQKRARLLAGYGIALSNKAGWEKDYSIYAFRNDIVLAQRTEFEKEKGGGSFIGWGLCRMYLLKEERYGIVLSWLVWTAATEP
jgi:hypothetical protein